MKAPRFTIRSLLILVALVAMLIEGQMLWSRSRHYHAKAMFHANQERLHKRDAETWIESADRTLKRVDADVARALKAFEEANAKFKENELYARANADSKIKTEHANKLREVYRLVLDIAEMDRKHCRRSQLFDTESAVRYQGYAENEMQLATYHGALARKYRLAASHPWFIVAADPPMPSTEP